MEFALSVTFIGITVVFVSLVVLSFLIYLLSKITAGSRTQKTAVVVPVEETVAVDAQIPEEDNKELIAVITGAVMAMMSKAGPGLKFKVRSLKRIDNNPNPWNRNR